MGFSERIHTAKKLCKGNTGKQKPSAVINSLLYVVTLGTNCK